MPAGNELRTGWQRDPAAFDRIYREDGPRLRGFLRQLVGSAETAEDLTQEIFTQLWRRPEGFDPERGSLRAYLFGMARHHAAEWWRRQRPTEPVEEAHAVQGSPERPSVIGDALRRLPAEQRALLWLREVEGQSYAELAAILGIPVGTVRSRLFTAREALRGLWLGHTKGEVHEVR